MQCALCKQKSCRNGQNCPGIQPEEIKSLYNTKDRQLMESAAKIEGQYYMQLSRIEESVKFAEEMGCSSVGIAFCMGLANEAKYIAQYFQKFFTVHSVCCKVCSFGKHEFNLRQIKDDHFEAMCNPVIQAKLLNDAKTELNFTIGLCVGHDMIFNSHSAAPVSTLVAKDRLLNHNPLSVIYSSYWRNKRLNLTD